MKISIIILPNKNNICDYINTLKRYIECQGWEIGNIFYTDMNQIKTLTDYCKNNSQVIFIVGQKKQSDAKDDIENEYITIDEQKITTVFLEGVDKELELIQNHIIPVLKKAYELNTYNYILKTYGLSGENLEHILQEITSENIKIKVIAEQQDCNIILLYDNNCALEKLEAVKKALRTKLSPYIYADSDISLAEAAINLLKQKGKKLAIAESYTGGNIAAELISVAGASDVIIEGIVAYSNYSKILRLGVDDRVISKEGAVSSQTAYEMAAGLLSFSGADYVLATTGYAGPTGDDIGLCYLALGDHRGIYIYKNKFEGDRQDIIRLGTKNAIFKLIEKLKLL